MTSSEIKLLLPKMVLKMIVDIDETCLDPPNTKQHHQTFRNSLKGGVGSSVGTSVLGIDASTKKKIDQLSPCDTFS